MSICNASSRTGLQGTFCSQSRRGPSMPFRAVVSTALGLVLLGFVSLPGCGSGASDGGSSGDGDVSGTTIEIPTATTTEASHDPQEAERQAVIDALLAAEDAATAATAPPTPNPEHPDLLATHTGPMLEQTQMLAIGLAANGWAIRLPENTRFRTEVESVEFDPARPDVAFLETCAVDDGERFVVATGEIIAGGLVTVEFTDAMQRLDGLWKLAERREENRWEGEAGCALD